MTSDRALPLKRVAVVLLTMAGIGFLVALAWRERSAVLGALSSLHAGGALSGLLLLVAFSVAAALLFADVAAPAQGGPQRRALAGVFLLSQAAKYVPGRVWSVVVQGMLMGASVSAGQLIVANIEITLLLLAAVVGMGAVLAIDAMAGVGWALAALVALWMVLLALVRANVLAVGVSWIRAFLPGRFKGAAGAVHLAPGRRRMAMATLLLCLLLSYGGGWLLLVWLGFGFPLPEAVVLVAVLCLSYALGVLSLLPAGIGAREAAFIGIGQLLHADMAVLATIAVLTRLAMVAIDLASLPVAWIMWRSATERR